MPELSLGAIKARANTLLQSSGFGIVEVVGATYLGVDANGNAVYSVRYNGYDPERSAPSSGSTNITVSGTSVSLGGGVKRGSTNSGGGGKGVDASDRSSQEGAYRTVTGGEIAGGDVNKILDDLENLFWDENDSRPLTDEEIFKAVDNVWNGLYEAGITNGVERGQLIEDILARASGEVEYESGGVVSIGAPKVRHKAGGATGEQWVWDIPTDEFGNSGFIFTRGQPAQDKNAPPMPVMRGTGGGGGGGGGSDDFIFMEPFHVGTYVRPDEGLVNDLVRSKMKIILGAADDNRVKLLTQVYMNAHKKQWIQQETIAQDEHLARQDATLMEASLKGVPVVGRDSLHEHLAEVQIEDPMQSVKEMMRTFKDYEVLHRARPTDMDEEDWIVSAISNQRQVGLGGNVAVERGQQLASVGDITADPSEFLGQRTMGTRMPTFFNKVDDAITQIARLAR